MKQSILVREELLNPVHRRWYLVKVEDHRFVVTQVLLVDVRRHFLQSFIILIILDQDCGWPLSPPRLKKCSLRC